MGTFKFSYESYTIVTRDAPTDFYICKGCGIEYSNHREANECFSKHEQAKCDHNWRYWMEIEERDCRWLLVEGRCQKCHKKKQVKINQRHLPQDFYSDVFFEIKKIKKEARV